MQWDIVATIIYWGKKVLSLQDVVARMEDGERFMVKFRVPCGGAVETMTSKLLDVAEDRNRLFVHDGKSIIWINASEIIEVYEEE